MEKVQYIAIFGPHVPPFSLGQGCLNNSGMLELFRQLDLIHDYAPDLRPYNNTDSRVALCDAFLRTFPPKRAKRRKVLFGSPE